MAGIASLVWSANLNLTGPQVTTILEDTAIQLFNSSAPNGSDPNRNDLFGYGLVDAGAAVRRAYALAQDPQLAGLFADNGYDYASGTPAPRGPRPGSPSGNAAAPAKGSLSNGGDDTRSRSYPPASLSDAVAGATSAASRSSTATMYSASTTAQTPAGTSTVTVTGSGTGDVGDSVTVSPAGEGADYRPTDVQPKKPITVALRAGQQTAGSILGPLAAPPAEGEPEGGLVNTGFDQGADGLERWTVSNSILVYANGRNEAVLVEGVTDVEVDLSQDFVIPQGMAQLTFTIDATTFDSQFQNGTTPDAFGVSLLDPATGLSLVPTVDGSTDSYYTQDLVTEAAPRIAATGVFLSQGAIPGSIQITLDTSALGGQNAQLVFRLIAGSGPESEASVTISVGQATPTVTVDPLALTYGTALNDGQLHGTARWLVNGEPVNVPGTFTYTSAAGTVLPAGSAQLEAVTFTPSDTTNYTTVNASVTINVAQATPTVVVNPVHITYGTALADDQLSGMASWTVSGSVVNVPGTFSFTSAAGTVLEASVAGYDAAVTFMPSDTTNYTAASASVTIKVAQATPTVAVNPVNITYGTALADGQLGGTATWTVSGSVVSVPGTFTYTSAAGAVLPVGSGQTEAVTFTPGDITNYTTASTTVTVNVTPAEPTFGLFCTPLGVGQYECHVHDATPGGLVTFVKGTQLGPSLQEQTGLTLAVNDPVYFAQGVADATGQATVLLRVPTTDSGRTLYVEAFEQAPRPILSGLAVIDVPFDRRLDFGTARSPVDPLFLRVTGTTKYNATTDYGWTSGTISSVDRGGGTSLDRDLNLTARGTFTVDVPNGTYRVDVRLGDSGKYRHDLMGLTLEGIAADAISTTARQLIWQSYTVNVADGQLHLGLEDLGGADKKVSLAGLVIAPVPPNETTPTVTISLPAATTAEAGQTAPMASTSDSPLVFNVVFSEPVADFTVGDVILDWSGQGVLAASVTGRGTTYQVTVSGRIPAGAVRGLSGLTNRASPSTTVNYVYQQRFDFGTSKSPVAAGYKQVTDRTRYNDQIGYGWLSGVISSADRRTGDAVDRDLNLTADGTFVVDVPDGTYAVTVRLGDLGTAAHDQMTVFVEGTPVDPDPISSAAKSVVVRTCQVTVADGQLTVWLKDQGGKDKKVAITSLSLSAVRTVASAPAHAESEPRSIGQPPQQNPALAADVNNDAAVTPLDALLVVNYLNALASSRAPTVSPRYLDVNGDGLLTPLDALRVVNHLNRQHLVAPQDEDVTTASALTPLGDSPELDDLLDDLADDVLQGWTGYRAAKSSA
jgi:hypothetical protein